MKNIISTILIALTPVCTFRAEAQRGPELSKSTTDAIIKGDLAAARRFLASGRNVNATNQDGDSAIHLAASGGHLDIVQLLLNEGANPNIENTLSGERPLHGAAFNGHLPIIKLLIKTPGIDLNAKTQIGETAAFKAAFTQNLDALKLLQAAGAEFKPSLVTAASVGNLQEIEALVKAGGDVNGLDCGHLPLCAAIYGSQLQALKLLLQKGAAADKLEDTGDIPIYAAIRVLDAGMVKELLKSKPNLALTNFLGMTPLTFSVEEESKKLPGKPEITKMLLDAGANVNQPNSSSGITPLMIAAFYGNPHMVKELINRKASLSGVSKNGNTVMTYAENGSPNLHNRANAIAILENPETPVQDKPSKKEANPLVKKAKAADTLTKAEWKARLAELVPAFRVVGALQIKKSDFIEVFGEPQKTQTIGQRTFWYYKCRDGTIQLDLSTGNLTADILAGKVNDY